MLLFQFIPPCPPTAVSTSLFSISASPFLPYRQFHPYHFSKCHMYALIWPSLVAQMVKNLPARQETWIQYLGLGRSPGEWTGYRLQYSCLENPIDRGAWWITVHKVSELDMAEQLSTGVNIWYLFLFLTYFILYKRL